MVVESLTKKTPPSFSFWRSRVASLLDRLPWYHLQPSWSWWISWSWFNSTMPTMMSIIMMGPVNWHSSNFCSFPLYSLNMRERERNPLISLSDKAFPPFHIWYNNGECVGLSVLLAYTWAFLTPGSEELFYFWVFPNLFCPMMQPKSWDKIDCVVTMAWFCFM